MNLEYANIYLNLKNDPEKALEYAMKEYKLRPENIDVNKLIATIYFQMDDLEKAEKHLLAATKTHSANPELLCLAGLLDIRKGNKDSGIITLKKSFEINPFQSHSLSTLGKNYILNGQNLSVAM
jgi:tetratricopeptide (TPR) repeat protein